MTTTNTTTTGQRTSKVTVQVQAHDGTWFDWMTDLNEAGALDVVDALTDCNRTARAVAQFEVTR